MSFSSANFRIVLTIFAVLLSPSAASIYQDSPYEDEEALIDRLASMALQEKYRKLELKPNSGYSAELDVPQLDYISGFGLDMMSPKQSFENMPRQFGYKPDDIRFFLEADQFPAYYSDQQNISPPVRTLNDMDAQDDYKQNNNIHPLMNMQDDQYNDAVAELSSNYLNNNNNNQYNNELPRGGGIHSQQPRPGAAADNAPRSPENIPTWSEYQIMKKNRNNKGFVEDVNSDRAERNNDFVGVGVGVADPNPSHLMAHDHSVHVNNPVFKSEIGDNSAYQNTDIYYIALIAGCSAAAVVGVVAAGICWYRIHERVKAAADVDYPAYGVTGPSKDVSPCGGDRKLAQSAHMYHYQHQKQQMAVLQKSSLQGDRTGSAESDVESDDDNEEGDYTVYECPGLAPAGDMEVKNPLFQDEPTPASPQPVKFSEDLETGNK